MIEATTRWSVTRRKIFTNCARRYAIKYIDNNRPYLGQIKGNYHSPWDLMIKTSREIFFQLLADLHRGVSWSDKLIQSRIRFGLTSNFENKKIQQEKDLVYEIKISNYPIAQFNAKGSIVRELSTNAGVDGDIELLLSKNNISRNIIL